nr:hypothetical protein [Tanacetum cinerariifolium]
MTFVSTPSTSNNDDVSTVFGVSTDSPQKTGKKITINGSDTAGYDKAKVECFNSHKMGHFARECRVPRNQENRTRNQEPTRRTINVEDTSSKAMVTIDGAGFYWSYMADDEAPTNMAFIAFSNSELIRSQITNKSNGGLGNVSYNVVPPPHTGRFLPLRIDLSHTGLPKFAKPSVESYEVKPIKVVTQTSSVKISRPVKENYDAPLIKDWESKRDDEVKSSPEIERKTVVPSVDKARCKYHQRERMGHSHKQLEDQGYFNSRCSKHMIGNISYHTDFKEFDEEYVAFGKGAKGGKITGKGRIIT